MLLLVEEFKACFTILEAGGGIVFNKRGEFLVIERRGVWDLPKGKVDAGETIEEAAVREVREECGLTEVHSEWLPLRHLAHLFPQGAAPPQTLPLCRGGAGCIGTSRCVYGKPYPDR